MEQIAARSGGQGMRVILEMAAADENAPVSEVKAAVIDMNEALLARLLQTRELLVQHELSEVRRFFYPDWVGENSDTGSATSELCVGLREVWIDAQFKYDRLISVAVDLAALQRAYQDGAKDLVATSFGDARQFLDWCGLELDLSRVGTDLVVFSRGERLPHEPAFPGRAVAQRSDRPS